MNLTKHLKLRMSHKGSKNSITNEILMISIITLIITTAIILTSAILNFRKMIIDSSVDKAYASIKYVEKEIQSMKKTVEEYAEEISENQVIITSSKNKSDSNIQSYLDNLTADGKNMYNFTVTDAAGKIEASTDSDVKQGSDLLDNSLIKAAISGKYGSDIGRSASGCFAVTAVSPVYDNEVVTGFVLADYNVENTEFIDKIKSFINSEITIFEDDVRINTTIIQDGKRLTGTKLESDIADKVINKRQEYLGRADIMGKPYITA